MSGRCNKVPVFRNLPYSSGWIQKLRLYHYCDTEFPWIHSNPVFGCRHRLWARLDKSCGCILSLPYLSGQPQMHIPYGTETLLGACASTWSPHCGAMGASTRKKSQMDFSLTAICHKGLQELWGVQLGVSNGNTRCASLHCSQTLSQVP